MAALPLTATSTIMIRNDRLTSTPAIRLRNRLGGGHTVTLVGGSSRIDAPRGTLRRPRADVLDQSLRPLVPKEAEHAPDVSDHAKGRSDAIATGSTWGKDRFAADTALAAGMTQVEDRLTVD